VSQRTQEIGIRVALGASDRKVLGLVVGHAAALTGAGLALGLAGALGLSSVIAGLLFRVSPTDPPTLAGGVILLSVVALLAAAVPARRAARVDPAVALRTD
ncbi:MAG TPA: FtsX-like permease family protein, partial [Gemmatimonadales bacterium]|nr:FtsX-like permease family protein [Gemmatimonadales bacterium]